MRKPPYLSSKKWNKKFQKNVRKFENFSDPSNGQKLNKSSLTLQADSVSQTGLLKKWVLFIGLCTFVKEVIANMLIKLTSRITEFINRGFLGGTATVDLETRIENLEETLKEYVKKVQGLELEVAKHSERLAKIGSQQYIASNVELVSGPHIQTSVPPTAPSFFPSAPPPPPPPPPPLPPLGSLSVQNQLSARKPVALAKKTQIQLMRPAISLEDIINVKLKRTPCVQRTDKSSRIPTPSNSLPRISLEALRSVKLKKTSLLKETSPIKSKSPKGKIRHALRRLPITTSPGGTPKYERICQQDDMTPIMSRVLLKRFNAFQMSPDEENKENDIQFL
ncbi:proline-rich protein 11-like isoform X1 [Daphnia carinata]|uniref:proline-rich protein 11-like isoform X1 n=1 Tax=Daphnia carinata TaxID=120202 RepID=UPI00257B47C5|nr:proline-rich protein 11-like isoform X1 [Daphnia carinata]XP_057378876.1 proline-rich protein 11-like isoform X1 [Daphnia carinata]XP_057378877.1 proline-rich protein 11-like isoform X1 [Daphnia carinata]